MQAGGACTALQQRGMAENLQDIAARIKSTGNIGKITKSMKMVSAAKLRGDTDRLIKGRPFGKVTNPIFVATPGEDDVALEASKKPMYVMITSDRGLCGGVNSFVAKNTKAAIDVDVENGKTPAVFIVGDKGSGPMARQYGDYLIGQVNEPWKTAGNFDKAMIIADRVISAMPEGTDEVKIVYNQFVSAIVYETNIKTIANFPMLASGDDDSKNDLPFPLYKYEGELESTEESLLNLFEFGLANQVYGSMIESATSEQSARMTAMDGASKNATEMVEALTIKYNRARQAKITTELIEIISGAESLKG